MPAPSSSGGSVATTGRGIGTGSGTGVWSLESSPPAGRAGPRQSRRLGLQYPQQLKESSPQAGDLQVTEPHLEMGTLVFAPP